MIEEKRQQIMAVNKTMADKALRVLADAFGFTTIGWLEYGIAMGLAVTVIPIVEFVKLIQRVFTRK